MTKIFETRILHAKEEMIPLLDLLQQLQPDLSIEKYRYCLDEMISKGYRMIALDHNGKTIGMTGIWNTCKFYCGRYMEIDNFIIDEKHRSGGAGKALTDAVEQLARKENCEVIMLDAYTYNNKAHKFYLREGFEIKGFHFIKKLS